MRLELSFSGQEIESDQEREESKFEWTRVNQIKTYFLSKNLLVKTFRVRFDYQINSRVAY